MRPVLIPIDLVPLEKATTQLQKEEKEERDELEQPPGDGLNIRTHEKGFVDQTFRKFGSWQDPKIVQMETTEDPLPTTTPSPVTPYTIVSSSMTVTKLVWENGEWDPQKVDKVKPYVHQKYSLGSSNLGQARSRKEEGFLESIGSAVFGIFGR